MSAEPKRLVLAAVIVVVVAAGVVVMRWGGPPAPKSAVAAPSAATARVVRTDLSDSTQLPGTLGFGAERLVSGTGAGVVTRLPKAGATVVRGKPLYWVNDKPVPVLFGATPLFRTLDKVGQLGSDVRVLADNLRAFGYHTGTQPAAVRHAAPLASGAPAQAELTPALLTALSKWQHDLGLTKTGALAVGQAVVLAGPSRVSALHAQVGAPAASELLAVTDQARVVTVVMSATETGSAVVGAGVKVALPNGKQIPARVASISPAVASPGDPEAAPKVNIMVSPLHTKDVQGQEAADVEVTFTASVHKGVLAVPVSALVALREGGYALQRADGGYLAVKTGMFAGGLVEVTGDGLTAGLEVVTAS
jgi:hypothetical protein